MAKIIKMCDYKLHRLEAIAKAKEQKVITYCDQYTKPNNPKKKEE